nr:hypothetical protein CDS [Bradyrhizobium sp.]
MSSAETHKRVFALLGRGASGRATLRRRMNQPVKGIGYV